MTHTKPGRAFKNKEQLVEYLQKWNGVVSLGWEAFEGQEDKLYEFISGRHGIKKDDLTKLLEAHYGGGPSHYFLNDQKKSVSPFTSLSADPFFVEGKLQFGNDREYPLSVVMEFEIPPVHLFEEFPDEGYQGLQKIQKAIKLPSSLLIRSPYGSESEYTSLAGHIPLQYLRGIYLRQPRAEVRSTERFQFQTEQPLGFNDGRGELYLDKEKMHRALRGEAVDLDLKPLEEFGISSEERERVFTTWGYTNATGKKEVSSLVRGEYLIDQTNQRITIKFLPGIHPHSFFGMTKDGRILIGVVPGTTHFRGTTLEDLAGDLISQGAQDVFLWTNGKDILMQRGTENIVEAEGSRRMGLEALIIAKPKSVVPRSELRLATDGVSLPSNKAQSRGIFLMDADLLAKLALETEKKKDGSIKELRPIDELFDVLYKQPKQLKLLVFNDHGQIPLDHPAIKGILGLPNANSMPGILDEVRKKALPHSVQIFFLDPESPFTVPDEESVYGMPLKRRLGEFAAAGRFAMNGGLLAGIRLENRMLQATNDLLTFLVRSELRSRVIAYAA